jgi:hypothetical protein
VFIRTYIPNFYGGPCLWYTAKDTLSKRYYPNAITSVLIRPFLTYLGLEIITHDRGSSCLTAL